MKDVWGVLTNPKAAIEKVHHERFQRQWCCCEGTWFVVLNPRVQCQVLVTWNWVNTCLLEQAQETGSGNEPYARVKIEIEPMKKHLWKQSSVLLSVDKMIFFEELASDMNLLSFGTLYLYNYWF